MLDRFMAQVIIVSNRLPVSVKKENGQLTFYPSVGGLATGLSSYVKNRNNVWIGWPGLASDGLTETEKHAITTELAKHNCAPVFLTQHQLDDYYNGFSNSVLWPLCHNLRVPSSNYHERWWRAYRNVNKMFADVVTSMSRVNSTIWVHDYQLLLVPSMLRSERSGGHIGLFMHIPFPNTKTFTKLPEAKRIIEGMLGAELIGFHTNGYVADFLENCQLLTSGEVEGDQLIKGDRIIRATKFPMGIDYEKYAAAGKSHAVKEAVKKYRRKYKGYKLIVTVDRLDPSKGLVERLQAYRQFLVQNPKQRGKVILSMVAAPSRTDVAAYKNLKKRLDTLVIQINEEFGTATWQPVDYIEGLPFEEVTALFRVADVAFIAPLRDGMNLVAKEFIASKDHDGVLILSETAGAAEELQDALLVDPKQPATVVSAIEQALTMPKRELRQRLSRMQHHLATNTVQSWANSFMKTLDQPLPGVNRTRTLTHKSEAVLSARYTDASKRLLLLDYDGTLMSFVWDYENAKPTPHVLDILQSLASDPKNEVVVISGRSCEDLETWLGRLPINLIAEHGAFTRSVGEQTWHNTTDGAVQWKQDILPIFQLYASKTPHAAVEEKSHSLVWHYRRSPPYYAQKYAVIIKRTLRPLVRKYHLELFNGNKILEVRDPRLNKGDAVGRWLSSDYDFVMGIGDDYTDEDMFTRLPADSFTIKVGSGRTVAEWRIKSPTEVRSLLRRLTR
jgi:trehalose 6-phosphate synthase/phosphatase